MQFFKILYQHLSGFVITVWNLFLTYWYGFLLLLLLIPLLFVAFRYIGILLCRARFLYRLKKHCKHRGISCQFSHSALPLLFSRQITETARLSSQDKSMTVYLFPFTFSKGGLYFKQDQVYVSKARALSLFSKGERGIGWRHRTILTIVEESAYKRLPLSLPNAQEVHAILVFCPSRHFLYAYRGNHYAAIDSGEILNGYCIYQSKELFHYLDRIF